MISRCKDFQILHKNVYYNYINIFKIESFYSCFLQHADTMKAAYTEYCVNHDKAEQLMEKYEATQDISRLLQRGIETIQAQVSCFNMGSILIKPVQRILKYPLILNELVKVISIFNDF